MRLVSLVLVLAVTLPAWAGEQSLQVIGWSADEQRFAVRVYDEERQSTKEEEFCPGYVNHRGERFLGSLKLGVSEPGKTPSWFPIQDDGKCTPPKKARERLEKAKQELARLGIDLERKQPGTELKPDVKGRVALSEGPGAPYTFEFEQQVTLSVKGKDKADTGKAKTQEELEDEAHADKFREHEVKGDMVVFVRKGTERQKLLSEPVNGTSTPGNGEFHEVRLHSVWLSPSGKRAVFISGTIDGGHQDSTRVLRILGVVGLDGEPVVLR